ncbi:glycosyltransferase family 4 protein [bacterium]|nr:glycosyltransferase family 4 protein [bacterium]
MSAKSKLRQARRIVFVDQAEDIGGAEQSLLELLPRLDRRRYQPLLLHTAGAHWADRVELADVPRLPVLTPSPLLVAKRDELKPGVIASYDHLIASRRPVAELRRAIVEQRADLVHTNALKSHLLGGFAATLARVPLVWHVRDILTEPPARKWLLQTARSFKPYIIAISEAVAEQFHPLRHLLHLRVIQNGIPLDKFWPGQPSGALQQELGLGPEDEVVLVVGRLTPWKGHEMLLQAMQLVREQRPRARLLVVGTTTFWEKSYEQDLRARAEALSLGDCVQWLGFRTDIADLLRLCNVFVLPSINEPFGRALVEAMAAAKPVVAMRSGGVPEVIRDGVCGLLIEPGQTRHLADAISRLLADRRFAHEMGQNGWRRANRYYDIRRVAREVQEVYEEILGR